MKPTKYIAYTNVNYRYQLADDLVVQTRIFPAAAIHHPFFTLSMTGLLVIKRGYAWDGISFFLSPQTKTSVKGTCVHDCLYQMLRLGLLDQEWKPWADEEMKRVFIASGMHKWRATYMYKAVLKHGKPAADPKNVRRVYVHI